MTYADPSRPDQTMHYVTRIVIERVDHKPVQHTFHGDKKWVSDRAVTELAVITLKADSLASLVEKAGKHLDLVEDIDATDVVRPKGTRGDV